MDCSWQIEHPWNFSLIWAESPGHHTKFCALRRHSVSLDGPGGSSPRSVPGGKEGQQCVTHIQQQINCVVCPGTSCAEFPSEVSVLAPCRPSLLAEPEQTAGSFACAALYYCWSRCCEAGMQRLDNCIHCSASCSRELSFWVIYSHGSSSQSVSSVVLLPRQCSLCASSVIAVTSAPVYSLNSSSLSPCNLHSNSPGYLRVCNNCAQVGFVESVWLTWLEGGFHHSCWNTELKCPFFLHLYLDNSHVDATTANIQCFLHACSLVVHLSLFLSVPGCLRL